MSNYKPWSIFLDFCICFDTRLYIVLLEFMKLGCIVDETIQILRNGIRIYCNNSANKMQETIYLSVNSQIVLLF